MVCPAADALAALPARRELVLKARRLVRRRRRCDRVQPEDGLKERRRRAGRDLHAIGCSPRRLRRRHPDLLPPMGPDAGADHDQAVREWCPLPQQQVPRLCQPLPRALCRVVRPTRDGRAGRALRKRHAALQVLLLLSLEYPLFGLPVRGVEVCVLSDARCVHHTGSSNAHTIVSPPQHTRICSHPPSLL